MDYEKKYKEALNWMRIIYPTLAGSDKEDAEHYFPELAESEDERIRKEIVHYILYKAKGVSEEQEHAWIVYLEKQNEQKHGAIDAKSERVIKAARSVLNNWLDGTDCPDVSGDFAELEYAIRRYDGEEKQKEQKLEQYDIDVLEKHITKDSISELAHTVIVRNGWEIVEKEQKPTDDKAFEDWLDGWFKEYEEDGEIKMTAKEFKNWSRGIRNMFQQKPVEIKIDNPNIQKIDPDVKISTSDSSASGDGLIYASWRDEKAEQKPNIELIKRSWYMEGYNDRDFNKEPKWIIKTGEGGPRYEENPKYGQIIEQKPADWSEDFDKEVENIHKRYPEVSFAKLTRIAYHFSKWANRRKDMEWREQSEKRKWFI